MEATLEKEKKINLTQWKDEPPGSGRRLRLLAEAATDFFDKSMEELRSKSRTNAVVWPRSCCMWIARDGGYTLSFIGDWWDKNHATVYHAINLVNDLRETKPAYDKQFRRFALFSKNYMNKRDNY